MATNEDRFQDIAHELISRVNQEFNDIPIEDYIDGLEIIIEELRSDIAAAKESHGLD